MLNDDVKLSLSASRRRIRTHAEWNVETHIIRARPPTSSATRSRISAAALVVNVIARIEPGWAPRAAMSQAMRRVSTRVLPDPAPATTSSGPPTWDTAVRWASLRPSRSSSERALRRVGAVESASTVGRDGRAEGTGKGRVIASPSVVVTPDRARPAGCVPSGGPSDYRDGMPDARRIGLTALGFVAAMLVTVGLVRLDPA